MSNPKLLVGLLIAALGLADAALLAPALMGSSNGPNGAGIIYYGLLFGQVSLCGIYSALAQAHFVLRGLLLGAALTLTPLLLQPLHGALVEWCMLVSVQLLCIVLPLTAIRGVAGVRLAWLTPVSLSDATSREMSRPLQFSLLHILVAVAIIAGLLGVGRGILAFTPPGVGQTVVWGMGLVAAALVAVGMAAYAPHVTILADVPITARPFQFTLLHVMLAITAIAVMLGAARGVLALTRELSAAGITWQLGLFAASLAVVGLTATWPGLGGSSFLVRGTVFLLTVGVVIVSVRFYYASSSSEMPANVMAISAIELAFALSVLRIAGFRLVRRRGRSPVARMEM